MDILSSVLLLRFVPVIDGFDQVFSTMYRMSSFQMSVACFELDFLQFTISSSEYPDSERLR